MDHHVKARGGFTREVESAAHLRQNGICALCGTSLMWGHDHTIPVFAIDDHPGNGWKKEIDNCVIVCHGCWQWAKIDDVHSPSARHEPSEYIYSFGRAKGGGYNEWSVRMMGRAV